MELCIALRTSNMLREKLFILREGDTGVFVAGVFLKVCTTVSNHGVLTMIHAGVHHVQNLNARVFEILAVAAYMPHTCATSNLLAKSTSGFKPAQTPHES